MTTKIDTPLGPLTAVAGMNERTRTTWRLKFPVENLDDLEKMRSIPWAFSARLKPPTDPELPDEFERRGVLRAGVCSPCDCVAGMMPREWFLELCLTDPELIDELTAEAHRRILTISAGPISEMSPKMAANYHRLIDVWEELSAI